MKPILTTTCEQTGILQSELLPRPGDADVKDRLSQAIAQARTTRAAIAYWTVGPDDVSPVLATRLGDQASFLCVDIHFPTDLDQINLLNDRGANVYLHLKHLGIGTETINRGLPRHLMHTKLLLFDLDDEVAEIWTGSHNWTLRALGGPNVEASLVLRVNRESQIYADTVETLEAIRRACHRFQPNELELYKQLQWQQKIEGQDELVPVIELEGKHAGDVTGAIALFWKSRQTWAEDSQDLQLVDQAVKLQVRDSQSGKVFRYDTRILHSGFQAGANPKAGGLAFSKRRYAMIDDGRQPELCLAQKPGEKVLSEAVYFVTLQVDQELLRTTFVDPKPNDKHWVTVRSDPLLDRMRPDHYQLIASQRHRRLSMQVPTFLVTHQQVEEGPVQCTLFPPEEQLISRRRRLISWKIARETDDQE